MRGEASGTASETALAERIASELRAAARFHARNGHGAVAEALHGEAHRHAREAAQLRQRALSALEAPA
ncbi:hypothetical protein [Methylobacterium oxalidis]|uniref:Uncharacterized protein n=1 Tax=Methylobacterium oxalidis TaxID=944322 RepID=A0A512J447_9HYPH|nr:hypothetical protein [Methylobacterium oxalidis]GEP04738.1 hypothetical protein MOX02_27760 [Methylobacterium oxalidis]GJE30438.1 hypothetical protein LDDCCGHA_0606 [Methylobacterium oxalidis]GLS63564.1 hypothetical protein GCM10007888_19450 [Methylobacterium oxalidis]